MSDFSTNPYAYGNATAAIATLGATAAFAATHDAVNRAIMIARLNSTRRQVANRIRRDRAERRQLALDLAIAKCDAALARYHLKRLAEQLRQSRRR
ncbi:UNVERIFIED_ORG: hypothetical protein M2193_001837 [Bradyrhizobium japonicum]|uniref:hypothetical protein n=1 Tax=Bradyrhizobium TaxID=374 RepID=UPI003494B80F